MGHVLCLLGIGCLGYGISVFLTFSGTSFFAVWLVLGMVLLGWAHAIRVGTWALLPAALRTCFLVICGVGLIALTALGALIMRDAHRKPPDGLDYLIVLGAQVRSEGPSVVLRFRLDAACDYLLANPDTRCVVSGGQGPNEPFPEADGMARYLVGHGIDERRIIREPRSETTVQNVSYSLALIDNPEASVGIVTNDFHVFRATRIARAQGVSVVAGIPGGSVPWYVPNNLLRECLGVIKDLLAGNMVW